MGDFLNGRLNSRIRVMGSVTPGSKQAAPNPILRGGTRWISVFLSNYHFAAEGTCMDGDLCTTLFQKKKKKKKN